MSATAEALMSAAAAFSPAGDVVIDCDLDRVFYGDFLAVRNSSLPIEKGKITGFIGPSGCGKSTVLRSLNRMNDLIASFRFEGHVKYHGQDIYGRKVDPVVVRRYIGMVVQQPNPFVSQRSHACAAAHGVLSLACSSQKTPVSGASSGRALCRDPGKKKTAYPVAASPLAARQGT